MDKDQINKMPAGRKMDMLVAVMVMGDDPSRFIWKRHGKPDAIQDAEYGGPREYSTDIDAAFDVVEKAFEHFGFTLSKSFDFDANWKGWMATDTGHIHGFGETPALAICRAALKLTMEMER